MSQQSDKIESLKIKGFTCFEDVKFEFSPGINVLIGANGTGKTHVLKLLYAVLKTYKNNGTANTITRENLKTELAEKLVNFYKSVRLGRLVRRGQGRQTSEIELHLSGDKKIGFGFATNSKEAVEITEYIDELDIDSLYIPPNEMLSLYEGFIAAYESRENSFDETYYWLAKALSPLPLRGARLEETKALINPLEDVFNADVWNANGTFYIRVNSRDRQSIADSKSTGDLEASLVGEGLRKIATLLYLIKNGSLTQNAVLFWDEPEANMNPKWISIVVQFLLTLAKNGVQIFLSTHDYLLSHKLSLEAEYREADTPPMRFFCLSKESELSDTAIEVGDDLTDLTENPILEEFAAHYDLESERFHKETQKTEAQEGCGVIHEISRRRPGV